MADVHTKAIRSYTMSRIRSKDSQPEVIVRKALFANGFRFRIHVKKLVGKPDIVLPKYKTIIFVNGCFWHAHEGCKYNKMPQSRQEYWIPKIMKTIERDKRNKIELENLGWEIITLWECQLEKEKKDSTLNNLTNLLQ